MFSKMKLFYMVSVAIASVGFTYQPTAKNIDVPPKDEWRVCAADSDCTYRTLDCIGAGPNYAGYNKKFYSQYTAYFDRKCRERIQEGEGEIAIDRIAVKVEVRCVKQKCEAIPPEPPPEEKPSYYERFSNWVRDLF